MMAAGWLLGRPGRGPSPAQARSLVILTIDTLRADRLDSRRMPALSAFAASGLRFDQARTAAPLTLPSHASLMTGLVPPLHGARENGQRLADTHLTLARVLKAAGFRTGAFVSAFVLDRQFGLSSGFEVYDDRVARDADAALRLEAERDGAATIDAALQWIGSIDRSRDRFFLWVHLFEPHAPYAPSRGCGAATRAGGDAGNEAAGDAGVGAYDRDVRCADTLAGRLIAALSGMPEASSTAWVIAGDHGEALGEHGEATHGMLLYDATLRVPLILHGPGAPAAALETSVSLVDVAPTVLRWLGLTPPAAMSGTDLLASPGGERDVYSETMYPRAAGWHGLSSLTGTRWKAIRSSEMELYDLQADRGETANLAAAHRQTADAMAGELVRLGTPQGAVASGPSSESRERLRALGYVSGAAASAGDRDGAPNPQREIASWTAFEQALTTMNHGRAAEALRSLATLAAKYPDGRVFAATHARALSATGDHRGALAIHRRLAARWPDDSMVFHDLAAAARSAGDEAEAVRAETAALALDPGNAAALNGLGLTHADAGRAADAARAFEQAAARDPGNASYWVNLGNARRALGNGAGAEEAYRRALERAVDHADALNGMGALMVQSGRARDAIAFFERAVAREPGHIEARLNLGIAYQESGRGVDAARAYREVLKRAAPGRDRSAAATLLNSLK